MLMSCTLGSCGGIISCGVCRGGDDALLHVFANLGDHRMVTPVESVTGVWLSRMGAFTKTHARTRTHRDKRHAHTRARMTLD